MSTDTKARAVLIRTSYDPSTWNRLPDQRVEIEAENEDELLALFFREYRNRYKYCNDVHFSFEDQELQKRFGVWMSDVSNYMNNGGDMY